MPAAPAARPLLVSADDELLDDALRLLAAAGAEPEVATAGPALRRAHREAPLVVLGGDVLGSGAVRALPRRPGVVVLTRAELPPAGWAAAVELGAERVAVLPADEAWVLQRAGAALRTPVDRGPLVAVGGACGGSGASTLAAAVALAAAAGTGALLVDADPWGGGLDLLVGAEAVEGVRWPDLEGLRGVVSGEAVMAALPAVAGVAVLAASRSAPVPPSAEAVAAVVEAGRSGGWPVVVDLPRAPGERAVVEAVLADADVTALVVPARVRAACAARALLDGQAGGRTSPWRGARVVVRRVPGGLDPAEVADVLGRPLLAELAHDRWAVARGERGEPPPTGPRTAWGAAARAVLAALPAPSGVRA